MNAATETIVTSSKMALVMDHLKNNRIEYLVVLLFSHVLGLTSKVLDRASGVCMWWLTEEIIIEEKLTAEELLQDMEKLSEQKKVELVVMSTVNKWKTSEGEEKQKLRNKLLKLTNIKKELESML